MVGRFVGLAGAVLVAGAILVGCAGGGGGDDGPTEIADKSLSKNQYIQQGDTICQTVPTRYQARLEKLPENQQENPKQSVPKAAIPPLWVAVDEFAALGAPDGNEAKAEQIVSALEKAARGLEKEPEGGLAGPESSFAEFNRVTQQYGFEACATL